jgi:subtilisin family serine protease
VAATILLCASALAGEGEPPVPAASDPGGVAVALIDTGVNYTLPHIAPRLARDAGGALIGHDFQDDDDAPFDLAPGQDRERGLRHGTRVASILLREAPRARLAPYRYKAKDFDSFARAVQRIAAGPARIVAMPLGGYKREEWEPFRAAAQAHPELLFIISAGNDGWDIDRRPVYPASFRLANAIVVTSTDPFGRLPKESNWGAESVDVSTPGERIETIDHEGSTFRVSGSSFAVPRIAALAARMKARHPDWDAAALKAAILKLAGPSPVERRQRVKHGWIANPLLAGD